MHHLNELVVIFTKFGQWRDFMTGMANVTFWLCEIWLSIFLWLNHVDKCSCEDWIGNTWQLHRAHSTVMYCWNLFMGCKHSRSKFINIHPLGFCIISLYFRITSAWIWFDTWFWCIYVLFTGVRRFLVSWDTDITNWLKLFWYLFCTILFCSINTLAP